MSDIYAVLENVDSKNNIRQYSVYIEKVDDCFKIVTFTGLKDGKKIKNTKEIKDCKNIGKKNETTLYSQTISEANGLIRKKQEKGYFFTTKPEEYQLKTNCKELSTTDIFPMLCEKYDKKYVVYPAFIQPKLDGVRAMYINNKLESRTKKIFTTVPYIEQELKEIDYFLDGELYNHGMDFQEIISHVSSSKKNTKQIEYHIFDVILFNITFKERLVILEEIKEKCKNLKYVKFVETKICEKEEELESIISYFNSYEGCNSYSFYLQILTKIQKYFI